MFKKLFGALIVLLCTACASNGQSIWSDSYNFGVVVNSRLVKGFSPKNGVEGKSDTGRPLFGFAELNERSGQTSGYGGIGLPKWVDVSWREGKFIQRYDPINQSVWTGGEVTGRYRIQIASRIPQEVLQYASAKKGRAIKLMFRILDDDVVLGWCVQEAPPPPAGGWVFSNYGGDFMPAKKHQGQIITMGWYLDKNTGQRIETTTGE